MARIDFFVDGLGVGLITEEVGSGKTVAVRKAVSLLEPSRHSVIYLSNPALGTRGIYQHIVADLDEQSHFHKASLIPQAVSLLSGESETGHKILVVRDEAHLLEGAQLEELKLLTNAEMDSTSSLLRCWLASRI